MLLFEDKILQNKDAFVSKVQSISQSLSINPDWLMAVMDLETGGTFNPAIRNATTGATGLIQFLPSTAASLGTSVGDLANMTNVDQLDYVYKYMHQYKQYLTDYISVYLAVFFPAALGKDDNYVIQTSSTSADTIARENPLFDINKDAQIKIAEIKQAFLSRIPANFLNSFLQTKDSMEKFFTRHALPIILVTAGLIGIIYFEFSVKTA